MGIEREEFLYNVRQAFFETSDLMLREIETVRGGAVIIFLDAMTDTKMLDKGIIKPLMDKKDSFSLDVNGLNGVLTDAQQVYTASNFEEFCSKIAAGESGLVFYRGGELFILPIRKYPMRQVEEPPTASVLKGPREGFTEDIKTNMVLIRRRLRTNKLVFKNCRIGRFTETTVAIAYIEGIVDKNLVNEIEIRLSHVDIDGIIDSSYLTKYLESKQYSLFKQVGNSEKPDIITAKLLEGRVAILVDGSPILLTIPFLLIEDFQDSQDYYKRPIRASVLRIIRLIAVFFALMLPGLFVALQLHQFQLLPLKLLITILNAVQGIPFSPTLEMLVALILFEILGEASIRMPRYVGMALSVVGAIVLGETAVTAGVLSSLTVLIVALSGIGIYAVPDEVGTLSSLRLLFVFAAGSLGIFGIILGGICIVAYLTSLDVYGVPYLAPMAPLIAKDMNDSIIKVATNDNTTRPFSLRNKNITRTK